MPDCTPSLAECLVDYTTLTCCSCEEAEKLRCIALARLKELTCGCMSSPVQIGEAKYMSAADAMNAIRRVIELTYLVCEKSAATEGPVMETIWKDTCGRVVVRSRGERCGDHECFEVGEYHRHDACAADTTDASAGETCN